MIFTKEHAVGLMKKMRGFYGKKFMDQWVDVTADEIAEAMCECLHGLSTDDLKRGYQRMMQSTFCPTIPEFRGWCLPKADVWMDAHEAWATAKNSIDFYTGKELTVVWTEQAAKAFAKCSDMVATGDKYQLAEAKKIFVAVYERLVAEAKDQGLKPVYNVSLGVDPDQRIQAIEEAQLAGLLTTHEATLQLEHKQSTQDMQRDTERYKTIAQQSIENLKAVLKIKATEKKEQEVKVIQPSVFKRPDEWYDPHNQTDLYVAQLKTDGKSVPMTILNTLEAKGGAV